jgi:hypothetical protein
VTSISADSSNAAAAIEAVVPNILRICLALPPDPTIFD